MKFYKIGLHFKILMTIRRISDNAILQYYYIVKVHSYKNMQISQTFSASEKKKKNKNIRLVSASSIVSLSDDVRRAFNYSVNKRFN